MAEFQIRRLGVIGAGQMGSQIAAQAALHGFEVALYDLSSEQLGKAEAQNRLHLGRKVAKGKLSQEDHDAAFARLRMTDSLDEACSGADFVLEAVVEKLAVKRAVFADLDRLAPPRAILATNSSYLMSSEIADATGRPEKVLNMHFFYPPLVMKLVEVVRGPHTDPAVAAATAELARRMGKVPVMLEKEMPGFLVNRILRAISNEAYFLYEEGVATFQDIDLACQLGLNHPLGPFQLGDFSGLDIGYNARREIYERTGREEDRPPPSLARRAERGDLGRKTGRGFYDYSTDPPTPTSEEG